MGAFTRGSAAQPRPSFGPRWTLALLGSAALPMVVVITTIGTEVGAMPPSTASALVGAAMISVLVFPTLGPRLSRSASVAKSTA
ncbi:hypothetical protein AB0H34_10180 [Saccharopolyspora shandongensis]|uniref:hypothetical protein n=1 Tax=Saccharopolyspora shandongensis TaxID=418495 RepID=UPI0033F69D23